LVALNTVTRYHIACRSAWGFLVAPSAAAFVRKTAPPFWRPGKLRPSWIPRGREGMGGRRVRQRTPDVPWGTFRGVATRGML